jgi:hypothetical protein
MGKDMVLRERVKRPPKSALHPIVEVEAGRRRPNFEKLGVSEAQESSAAKNSHLQTGST